jgi:hypothetical protein
MSIYKWKNRANGPTILERGLPICGLRPYMVSKCSKSITISTPHIGHSRHGLFFKRLDYQYNAKPSEKAVTMAGTFGLAVSIPNHYTI